MGDERTGGRDHKVGLSVFPLAWILNKPSANQYGSLRRLVLFPELPSYDILRSSIHHQRCRYEMSNILGITMFDLNQSFLFLQQFHPLHPLPHQFPDTNTPSPFLNCHNPRPSSFPKYSHPPSLSNYLLLPHLPDRNGLPFPLYLSYLYHLRSTTLPTRTAPSPRTRSLNLGKANLLQFIFFIYLSAITDEFSYQHIV